MVFDHVRTRLGKGTEHSLQGYEEEPGALVREEVRVVVVVWGRLVDEVEVCRKLAPLLPLPFLLPYTKDVFTSVKSFGVVCEPPAILYYGRDSQAVVQLLNDVLALLG